MDVILLERIGRLGQMGDTVSVRDGYARNYLLPKGKALRASEANRKRFESQRADLEARNEERRRDAAGISEALNGKSFVAVRSAGETGQLYGSVSTRDIAEILVEAGHQVHRNQVDLRTPIKTIGLHAVRLVLHPDVDTQITLNVARTADEAERQARGEDLSTAAAIYGIEEREPGAFDDADMAEAAAEIAAEESAKG